MKKIIVVLSLFILTNYSYAQTTINGLLDSSLSATVNDGDFSYGVEEFANIRFQSRLRDNRATVYGAVNLIAASGDYALEMARAENRNPAGVFTGANYTASIGIERLYFRLNFENANLDAGLFRIPFGYSTVWGSSDFLNPKNPVKPDARPLGILGTAISWYPFGDLKFLTFAAVSNSYILNQDGFLTGFSVENHWRRVSAQSLYSYELSDENYWDGDQYQNYQIHRAGFSLKADIGIGLTLDALYTYTYEKRFEEATEIGIEGLSLSAGADYSFFGGKLVVMAEYLFNGENSSTAWKPSNPLGMLGKHYLYSGFTWLFNDFTNINIALISCFDDVSFTPMLSFNHELFQGASLMIMALSPLSEYSVNNGIFIFNCSARLRLRF